MAARTRGVVITVVLVVAVIVAAVVAIKVVLTTAKASFSSDTCTVASYDLDPAQASVAAAMVGAVTKYPITLPDRAAVLVLAAALQESKLTNLAPGEGDRDSVGVLQQRPSQGWGGGKASVLNDVSEATTEFLAALVKVRNWEKIPLSKAIQAVQISADGSAYAQHEPEAKALAETLLGRRAAGISCDFSAPTQVAAPTRVAALLRKELGISTPAVTGTTVRVPGAGWQTAGWLVANADRLGIESVAYAGKRWSRAKGWKATTASRSVVVATMATVKK